MRAAEAGRVARHAVYWVPAAQHPLWSAGCAWLGRDPSSHEAPAPPPHRSSPWRYGFHATVKAPMVLATDVEAFEAELAAIARAHAPVPLPAFEVTWFRRFLALCPVTDLPAPFKALAACCVERLDAFRAPPDAAERARRIAGLDAGAVRRYDRWGYPHVFDHWRMHLTLSDTAERPAWGEALAAEAQAHFAEALARPMGAGELAWFIEPEAGAPFQLVRRFALGAGSPY